MNKSEFEKLRFRRQYVLTAFTIECPFLYNVQTINEGYFLYTHVDLNVTTLTGNQRKIVLLGDLFDFENPAKSNNEIISDLFALDLFNLIQKVAGFCGRYVIILADKDQIYLIHDAASSRKVYYYHHKGVVCCASQPHLIAKVLDLELTSNESKLSFYGSKEFIRLNNSNLGNTTCYDNVYQLIPNHYLHLNTCTSTRYWPNKRIEQLPLDEIAERCSVMIKGFMESIAKRYDVMLPVTAGKDSRLLLSATYNFKDKVFFYINKENRLNDKSYDITIPKKLLPKLNLDFHILDPYIEIDDTFRKIYFENNRFASTTYLPPIYNYYANYSNKINLPGIFVNIIEDVFELHHCEINAMELAKLIHVEKYDYAIEYYSDWLNECKDICQDCNINVLNLLYWEERIANWGTQIQLDKDIAQDEIIPYNSRLLMEIMLSAKLKYREKPDFTIFSAITQKLWPEALQEPCNPDFKQNILKISKNLGIMKPVKSVYYLFQK